MKALFTLNSLSNEEKELLKAKQINAERTVEEWFALFTKLRDFDKQGDRTRKWSFGIGCFGIILAIVGILLIAAFVGVLFIPLGIILAVAGIITYFYIKRFDIPGEVLTNTVIPILTVLREDMKSNQKLQMRLDLRGFAIPEKLSNQSEPYASGVYHKIVDSFYRDHWFDGKTILADGTHLIWSIHDLAKRQNKSKRNYRGKHKSKTKDKHRSFISMQIGMKSKRYTLPKKFKEKSKEGAIVTKSTDDFDWMDVRRNIKHPDGQTFQPTDFVNAIASAYLRATPHGEKKK